MSDVTMPPNRRGRKFIGMLVLVAYLIAYVWAVVSISASLASAPNWAQLIFYVVAGFVWVAPLKPLFGWMNAPEKQKET
ncbi:MAG: DUF2842 domain-containing protein [Pseudomonadota bacterium]